MSTWRRRYHSVIRLLGHQANFEQADGSNAQTMKVGLKQTGRDETEIIQAYGARSVALTVGQDDISVEPKKFDRFMIDGQTYVVQSDAVVNHFGWRLYARAE